MTGHLAAQAKLRESGIGSAASNVPTFGYQYSCLNAQFVLESSVPQSLSNASSVSLIPYHPGQVEGEVIVSSSLRPSFCYCSCCFDSLSRAEVTTEYLQVAILWMHCQWAISRQILLSCDFHKRYA